MRHWRKRAASILALLLALTAISAFSIPKTARAASAQQGLDVSQYQGTINWSQVAAGGFSFSYIRAVTEVDTIDTKFYSNWNGAMGAGVTPGAYVFFNASLNPNTQANLFIDTLRSVNFVRGDLNPAVDVEVSDGQPASVVIANLQTEVNDITAAIGVAPTIYTNHGFWDGTLGAPAMTADPLWIAAWCGDTTGSCIASVPGHNWGGFGYQAWQYNDCGPTGYPGNASVPGISGCVDVDQGNPIAPAYDGNGSIVGTHFAPVGTSGSSGSGTRSSGTGSSSTSSLNAAMAVMDSRIYGLTSTGSSFSQVNTWLTTPFYGTRVTTFADVDGSGRASAVAIDDGAIFVAPNTGSGTFGSVQNWSSTAFYGELGTYMADLQGNGYASPVAINSGSVWIEPNTGHGTFGPPQEINSVPFYGTRGTFLADVDGSGRASLVAVNNDSIWVLVNNGHGFNPPQEWSAVPFYGTRAVFFADLDGPGKPASAIALNDDSIWVEKNLGSGFGMPQEWSAVPFYGKWTYMADLDGTGRASIVAVNPDAIWVEKNNGTTSFSSPAEWYAGAFYGTH